MAMDRGEKGPTVNAAEGSVLRRTHRFEKRLNPSVERLSQSLAG